MKTNTNDPLINKFLSLKGQAVSLEYQKPIKTYKTLGPLNLTKRVKMVCRAGCEYDHIKAVQDKRESGELPEENQGLPYGKWVVYKYLIEHNGELQLRFERFGNKKEKTQYFLDGREISEERARELGTSSEFKDKEDVFNLRRSLIVNLKSGEEV